MLPPLPCVYRSAPAPEDTRPGRRDRLFRLAEGLPAWFALPPPGRERSGAFAFGVPGRASLRAADPPLFASTGLRRGAGCRGSKVVRVSASGAPAIAQYRRGSDAFRAWAIHVVEIDGDRIRGLTFFLDTEVLFPAFGLPLTLPL